MECQIDKAAEQLGLDPADMRRRNLAEPFVKTANHLTVTTIGLGECIDRVVEASGWREKRGNLPAGKGIGIACSSYLTGAGTAVYWNDMPHSGVVVRADRSGLVAAGAGGCAGLCAAGGAHRPRHRHRHRNARPRHRRAAARRERLVGHAA
jgi:4-hydroxybenzoyl-CoA reductase subunit alpha